MTFQHPELQKHYERVTALNVGGLAECERPVFALMDAYGWFRLVDGDQTAVIQEIIGHLLSPELRAGLRSWYQRQARGQSNATANEFRDKLSQLSGENFG